MPEEKHLRGAGENEQRRYEQIKEEAEKEGRYRGREREVAARTVLNSTGKKGGRATCPCSWWRRIMAGRRTRYRVSGTRKEAQHVRVKARA